ncbi:MAG: hypothetical protein IBX68_02665 [Dehalococcoidia bacterium]|nr:hypothetical protein [Dehalococcoidia bacterium]
MEKSAPSSRRCAATVLAAQDGGAQRRADGRQGRDGCSSDPMVAGGDRGQDIAQVSQPAGSRKTLTKAALALKSSVAGGEHTDDGTSVTDRVRRPVYPRENPARRQR